ncbi:MAG: hypothetical protein NZ823_10400 [Blastocatellia bacterium]|nr:hypothetical protein [Blastocatellia bacterium]
MVAIGEMIDMKYAPGIKVKIPTLMYNTERVKIMTIRVHAVLKGKGLVVPGSIVEALVLPSKQLVSIPADFGIPLPKSEEPYVVIEPMEGGYKLWRFPYIEPGEKWIFFLEKVREGKDDVDVEIGSGEVTGIRRYYPKKKFYAYTWALEANPDSLLIIKRYTEIDSIRDRERREQEFLEFSMSLIENLQIPELFAASAAEDLRSIIPFRRRTALERLTDKQIEKLIRVASDPSRPRQVRVSVRQVLDVAYQQFGRSINVAPFLRVIEDPSEDVNLRYGFFKFLEEINTPQVREGFKKILQREPTDQYEAELWERIKRSKILKDEEPQQE